MTSMNKLQIRAEILNAVKALESVQKHTPEFIGEVVLPLLNIEDKKTILDVLVKEILAAKNDERFLVLSYLIESIVPKDMLEAELWKLLNLPEINDRTKANIINILKDLGNQINYEKYVDYFENPDAVIDEDTEKMLKSAVYNPEALIDFLDFIEALPEKDRGILIDSLCEDYNGDELANLFIPAIYANPNSELCKYAIAKLGESKSALAIRPLNWLLDFTKDAEIASLAKKSLNMLKIAGARTDITDEYYEKVLENTKLEDIYISMPDGRGNVGLIADRVRTTNGTVQMLAVVFNDSSGIVDCFGFNELSEIEFNKIVNRFYSNQEKIQISAKVAKLLLDNAENIALKTAGNISYEYVCWKRLFADVNAGEEPIHDVLAKKLVKQELAKEDLEKLYSTSIFDQWFLDGTENSEFAELLKKTTEILSREQNTDKAIDSIKEQITENFDKIWNDTTKSRLKTRLLLSAYLLYVRGLHTYANTMYSLCDNEELLNCLLLDIINTSIYEFLLRERAKHQNVAVSTNIFSRRNEANKAVLDKKTIENTIKVLENRKGL